MFRKKNIINKVDYDRIQEILESMQFESCQSKVVKLKNKIKKSSILTPDKINPNVITVNTRFRLKNLGNGMKEEFTLVFPDSHDSGENMISVLDDHGLDILSSEIGDVVSLGNGAYYQVENIIYQPEADNSSQLQK